MKEILTSFFLIILIISFTPFFIFIINAGKKALDRRKHIRFLINSHVHESDNEIWFPVRYASDDWFHKIWKLFPWEDYGILLIRHNGLDNDQSKALVFYSKEGKTTTFIPDKMILTWIGAQYWPNGIYTWFRINYNHHYYYFTSETGIWAARSDETTEKIYEAIRNNLAVSQ